MKFCGILIEVNSRVEFKSVKFYLTILQSEISVYYMFTWIFLGAKFICTRTLKNVEKYTL